MPVLRALAGTASQRREQREEGDGDVNMHYGEGRRHDPSYGKWEDGMRQAEGIIVWCDAV